MSPPSGPLAPLPPLSSGPPSAGVAAPIDAPAAGDVTAAPPGEVGRGMEPSDRDLVRRVRAGDTEAYAPLVERHYTRFLRFATRMLGDRADAEEAVQDAFVRAYRALDRYEERDRFDGWLLRIVVNQCRTAGARSRRRARTFVSWELAEDAGEWGPAPSRGWSAAVRRALDELAPDVREALLLKYVEEQSYEEIAETTGLGVSALKMRVKRARERLRARLEEVFDALDA